MFSRFYARRDYCEDVYTWFCRPCLSIGRDALVTRLAALLRLPVEPQFLEVRHFANIEGHVNNKQISQTIATFTPTDSTISSLLASVVLPCAKMTSGSGSLEKTGGASQFTKADQIKQLNDIDKVGNRLGPPPCNLRPSLTSF